MILVDSSVWIDALKERDTKQARLFKDIIRSPEAEICTCPTIIQEVLQGVRDDDKHTADLELVSS
jgi:predicted nucleic acid-binding protein